MSSLWTALADPVGRLLDGVPTAEQRKALKAAEAMLAESRASRFDDLYEATATLGRGATAAVWRCVHKPSGTPVAVKAIDLPPSPLSARARARRAAVTELACNLLLQGAPHAVELLGAFEEGGRGDTASSSPPPHRIMLVTRLCAGGELFDDVIRKSHYCEREAALAVRALALYLAAAHAAGVVHRDLKPENVLLLSREGEEGGGAGGVSLAPSAAAAASHLAPPPRLTRQASLAAAVGAARPCTCAHRAGLRVVDLGCAALVPRAAAATLRGPRVGTPYYVAPEVVTARGSAAGGGRPSDVWSLGVIAYILLSGRPPFGGADDAAVLRRVRRGAFSFAGREWAGVSREAKDAIAAMLVADPAKRATATDVLALPWVARAAAAPAAPLGGATLRRLREFAASSRLHAVAALALTRTVSAAGAAQLRDWLAEEGGNSSGSDSGGSAPATPTAAAGLTAGHGFLTAMRNRSRAPLSRLGSSVHPAGASPRAATADASPRPDDCCPTCCGVLPASASSAAAVAARRRTTTAGGTLSRGASTAAGDVAAVRADAADDDAPGADAAAEAALDAMLPAGEAVAAGSGLPPRLPPPLASSLLPSEPTVDADRAAELAFAALDADGDGYVCAADLCVAAAATGAPAMTAADAAAAIADADADGDGRLTFDEFKAAIWTQGKKMPTAHVVAASARGA